MLPETAFVAAQKNMLIYETISDPIELSNWGVLGGVVMYIGVSWDGDGWGRNAGPAGCAEASQRPPAISGIFVLSTN